MPVIDKNDSSQLLKYKQFVENSPFASATQDPNWASVKQGWGDAQITLEENGNIVAAISLLIRPVLGKWCMLYAPRGPVCDPNNTDLLLKLISEVDKFAKKKHAFLLRFDPEIIYSDENIKKFTDLGFILRGRNFDKDELIQPLYNMILPLSKKLDDNSTIMKSEEELMSEFSQKTRYNIRIAKKKGVTVRYSRDKNDLDSFYEIFKTTCIRDKIGGRTKDYFERMLDAFGENCRIYLGEFEGKVLSGAIAISYGNKMWYSYGASSNELRNLMPNYLMQLEMIRWGLEQKKDLYDFGGVFELTKENGLYRFKEGFCHTQGVTEYIGELDKVYNKLIYYIFNKAIPAWKNLKSMKKL